MTSSVKSLPRDRFLAPLLLAAALAATTAAYARVLRGEFQFDDERIVQRNLLVKDLGRFADPGAWALAARPLTALTFALNYEAGRLDPVGFHATNLALHLAAALLVFLLARRTLREAGLAAPDLPAAATAAVFALHPLQTESVSYVVQRSELLASLLYVAALLLLLAAEDASTPGRRAAAYAGALGTAAAALLAKPVAATLPAAYLLHRLAFAADRSWPRLWRRTLAALPLLALSAATGWSAAGASAAAGHGGLAEVGASYGEYLLTQLRVAFRYVGLLVLPVGQNVDPDVAVTRTVLEPGTAAAGIGWLAVAAAAVAGLARSRSPSRTATAPASASASAAATPTAISVRVAAFGALWFLLLLLPTSLVPLADLMAEHRVYLASFGLLLGAAVAAQAAADALRVPTAARGAVLAGLLAVLAVATFARNAVWESRVALWTDAAERSPQKARPLANLGWSHTQRGEHDLALAAYGRALAQHPDPRQRAEVLRNLGSSLAQLGRHAEATAALAAAAQEPDVEADARALLAMSDLALGRFAAAREEVTRALRVDPDHGVARNTLGQVLLAERNPGAALEQFRIAVRLDPDSPARRSNVAFALEQLGRAEEACAAWRDYLAVEGAPAGRQRAAAAMAALGGCRAP